MDTLEDNTLLIGDNTSEGIKNRIQRVNENILNFNFDGKFAQLLIILNTVKFTAT